MKPPGKPVLVVGGCTTGLTMACELARHGVPVRIIDESPGIDPHCRANLLHSRSLEIFEDLGIVDELLEEGLMLKGGWQYANGRPFRHFRYGDVESPYPFGLALGQNRTEAVLERLLNRLGCEVERNTELVDFDSKSDHLLATLRRPDGTQETMYTPWLIGCDGAHSRVRTVNALTFPGEEDVHQYVLADVAVEAPISDDEWHGFLSDSGTLYFFIHAKGRRLVVADIPTHHDSQAETPTLEEIQALVDRRGLPGMRIDDPRWLAYFRIHYRVARHYRKGRTFMAGDAVHVHSLIGGQGMNTGIQDAYNLAWKLALVIRGKAPQSLLDSYEIERRQVAEDVIRTTRALTERDEQFAYLPAPEREKIYFNVTIPEAQRLSDLHHFEELDLDYRTSPICVDAGADRGESSGAQPDLHAGAEARNAGPMTLAGEECMVFDLLRGTKHTALLFAAGIHPRSDNKKLYALAKEIAGQYPDLVNVFVIVPSPVLPDDSPAEVPVVADPTRVVHERYGAKTACLYLIRPDGHVGYRGTDPSAGAFNAYMQRVFVRAPGRTQ